MTTRGPGQADRGDSGSGQVVAAGSAGGSIYDLGYRGYQGVRLGRRHAVASLARQSFRQSWGLGRPGRAKIVPFGLAAIATIPAVVALGVAALAQQLGAAQMADAASPIRYETYYSVVGQVVFLFAAAQAPELLVRDQRHRVLALFFSRAIRREDYAIAKLLALGSAMLLLVVFPQLLIFVGRILLASDIPSAITDEIPKLPPILGPGGADGMAAGRARARALRLHAAARVRDGGDLRGGAGSAGRRRGDRRAEWRRSRGRRFPDQPRRHPRGSQRVRLRPCARRPGRRGHVQLALCPRRVRDGRRGDAGTGAPLPGIEP